jgi:hypothetical protein
VSARSRESEYDSLTVFDENEWLNVVWSGRVFLGEISVAVNDLDRTNAEIDIPYRCVRACRNIGLIGQCYFSGAGRSKDRRDGRSRSALIRGTHSRTTAVRFTLKTKSMAIVAISVILE